LKTEHECQKSHSNQSSQSRTIKRTWQRSSTATQLILKVVSKEVIPIQSRLNQNQEGASTKTAKPMMILRALARESHNPTVRPSAHAGPQGRQAKTTVHLFSLQVPVDASQEPILAIHTAVNRTLSLKGMKQATQS